MFKKLFERIFSKEIEGWEEGIKILKEERSQMEDEIVELESKVSDLESKLSPETDELSNIIFYVDKDLKISIKTKVNKDIALSLVDNGIINNNEVDNIDVLQYALVFLANESSEQIIMGVNGEN